MYYVYVVLERHTSKTYIGYTDDLKRRLAEHLNGRGAKTTKSGDWRLAYYEAFSVKQDAMERETKLKHHGMAKKKLFERLSRSLAGQNRAGEAPNRSPGKRRP